MRFRSWHRGTREADLLIGRFADRHLGAFSEPQLDQFEKLLAESDPDIYNWVTEREASPAELDTEVLRMLTRETAQAGAAASPAG
jgi:antitoxin CptB